MKNIFGTTFLDRIQRIAVETQHYQHTYHDVRRYFSAVKSEKRDVVLKRLTMFPSKTRRLE